MKQTKPHKTEMNASDEKAGQDTQTYLRSPLRRKRINYHQIRSQVFTASLLCGLPVSPFVRFAKANILCRNGAPCFVVSKIRSFDILTSIVCVLKNERKLKQTRGKHADNN